MLPALPPPTKSSRDYEGRYLELLGSGMSSYQPDYFTDDAYTCCMACFQTPNCFGANYGAGFGATPCELEVGTTCPASQGGSGGDYTDVIDPSLALTFSNGPCGTYSYSAS